MVLYLTRKLICAKSGNDCCGDVNHQYGIIFQANLTPDLASNIWSRAFGIHWRLFITPRFWKKTIFEIQLILCNFEVIQDTGWRLELIGCKHGPMAVIIQGLPIYFLLGEDQKVAPPLLHCSLFFPKQKNPLILATRSTIMLVADSIPTFPGLRNPTDDSRIDRV